jgi:hypothetical protein
MQTKVFEQTSKDSLDYIVNWINWLDGDTIATSTWAGETGLTIGYNENLSTAVLVWVAGGENGKTYWALNTITTAEGRTKTFKICFKINDGCCQESDDDYCC